MLITAARHSLLISARKWG